MQKTNWLHRFFGTAHAAAKQLWSFSVRHKLAVISTLAGVVLLGFAAVFTVSTQFAVKPAIAGSSFDHRVNQPITVRLGQAVRADFEYKISPDVKGEWHMQKNLFGVYELAFTPTEKGFSTKTEYKVMLQSLERVTGQSLADVELSFTTEAAPAVALLTPTADMQNFAADGAIEVKLASKNRGMRDLSLQLEPTAELKLEASDDQTFRWKSSVPLEQGKPYSIKLFDARSSDPKTPIKTASFTTSPEPAISKTNNEQFLYPEGAISVTFDTAMRQDTPAIRCECAGEGKWVSETEFHFKPAALEVAKTYKYVVPQGVRAVHGGFRAGDMAFEVRTPGHVQASIGGLGNSAKLSAPITVTFDQIVDKASAEARFAISPQVSGSFRWVNGATMQFVPGQEYGSQTDYTVVMHPGVAPARFGLPSNATFSMRFTTEPRTLKLAVPSWRQQHPSSCEAAALRMALAYRGIQDSDASIVQKMGYAPRSKDDATNSWDDPNQMYVGDINGGQSRYQAYGAYAPPIAKAAQAYGRGASVHYGVSASFIAQQIYNDKPVIIIGTVSHMRPTYIAWNGPNGVVHAWMGEHARTVVGVVGSPDNPIGFWVNDPYRGTHEYWTPGRLMSDINAIPQLASQVVVVH